MSVGGNGPNPLAYSCVRCKERKVRCDRSRPCEGCVRLGVECVGRVRAPYSRRQARSRAQTETGSPSPRETRAAPPQHSPRRRQASASEDRARVPTFGQNLWTGLQDEFRDPRANGTPITESDEPQVYSTPLSDPSAFIIGGGSPAADLRDTHPSAVNVFTLWQAFLRNVNPLTKVVHAPTVQDQVVEAARDFSSVSRNTAALLFAVYSSAVASMSEDDCRTKLGEEKTALLARYLAATQQALAAAGFLESTSLVVLQAFTLYLIAARQRHAPSALWILAGMAVRMGQRLDLGAEETPPGTSYFDLQMRRRVWWQITFIDGHATQSSLQKMLLSGASPAAPLPANLNDADIGPSMTEIPQAYEGATEMIFCLVRYEVGRFLVDEGEALHSAAMSVPDKDRLIDQLEDMLTNKYLAYCDPAIPIHLVAAGGARSVLCKLRLMAHHPSQYADKGRSIPQAEHDMLFSASLEMSEMHVRGYADSKVAGFRWHIDVSFQLDAFVFMMIEFRYQPPTAPLTEKAWGVVADIFKYRPEMTEDGQNELYSSVRQLVLHAWSFRESEARRLGLAPPPAPPLIAQLREMCRAPQQAASLPPAAAPAHQHGNYQAKGSTSPAGIAAASHDDASALAPETMDLGEYSYQLNGGQIGDWDAANWESWDFWDEMLRAQGGQR